MSYSIFIDTDYLQEKDFLFLKEKVDLQGSTIYLSMSAGFDNSISFPKLNYLEGKRDYKVYRKELMEFLDSFFSNKNHKITYKGYDLFDIVRFDFLFSLQNFFYKAWVTRKLHQKHANTTILYFKPAISAKEKKEIRLLKRSIAKNSINFQFLYKEQESFFQSLLAYFKLRAFKIKEFLISFFPTFNSSNSWDNKGNYHTIFVENYPNSAKLSLKVFTELLDKENIEPLFIALRPIVLKKLKLTGKKNFINYQAITPIFKINSYIKYYKFKYSTKKKIHHSTDSSFNSNEVFSEYIRHGLEKYSCLHFKKAIFYIENFTKIFGALKSQNFFCTTYAGTYARSASSVAESLGINTFYLQHGLLIPYAYTYHFIQKNLLLWGPFYEKAIREACPQKKIWTVGPYGLNLLQKSEGIANSNSPFVVSIFLSRAGGSVVSIPSTRIILQVVLEAISQLKSHDIITYVKIHPGNRIEDIMSLVDKVQLSKNNVQFISQGDPIELVNRSNVCLVSSSTMGLQICAKKIPLVYLNPPGSDTIIDYEKFGAAFITDNHSDLAKIIDSIYHDKDYHHKNGMVKSQEKLVDKMLNGLNLADLTEILS